MGRVNYGSKLQAETQQKGIRNGVILDIHFTKKWKHYCLNFEHLDLLNWEMDYQSGQVSMNIFLKLMKLKKLLLIWKALERVWSL